MVYWICCVSVFVKVRDAYCTLQILTLSEENETLSKIGTSCLQQFVERNVQKLSTARWECVTSTFVKLFQSTTPHQLFSKSLRVGSTSESTDSDGEK